MTPLAFDLSRVTSGNYAFQLAALLAAIVLYLLYKVAWPRDFGVPVRRRLICRGLRIERDQLAFAPLWWSDIQIQRAIRAHWKQTMIRGLPLAPPPAPG